VGIPATDGEALLPKVVKKTAILDQNGPPKENPLLLVSIFSFSVTNGLPPERFVAA